MVASVVTRLDCFAIGSADQWALGAGADKIIAVNTNDGDTGYIDANSNDTQRYAIDPTFASKFGFISDVSVYVHCRWSGTPVSSAFTRGVRLDATDVSGSSNSFTESYALYSSLALARPNGGSWVDADFRGVNATNRFMIFVFIGTQTPVMRVTELYVEVTNIPLNRTIDLEREVASRWLRARREPEEIASLVHGWEALEAELMDPIGASHVHGPTYDGKGWGVEDWKRLCGILKSQQISLSMPHVTSLIGNRRRFQTTCWETMKLVTSGDPDIAEGLARLDAAGAEREFERSSNAWFEDAGGVIRLVTSGKEKITPQGIQIEATRDNWMTQSSFVNGTTGWTKTENSGAGTFAADTENLLFEPGVSAQSVKMTITSAPYDIDISRVTDSLTGSTEYVLSFDWEQNRVGIQKIAIQNDGTGNWLQADGGSWGVSRVDIELGTEVGSKQRDLIVATTEAGNSTHTVHAIFTGSVDDAVHNIFHVQVELGAGDGFATSRIVTEASLVTRASDDLRIRNDASLAQRIWPIDKFTAEILFTPQWNSPDLSSSMNLLDLFHDADNAIRITHFNTNTIHFEYEHDGTVESAAFATPGFTRGTEVRITIRKTSDAGELDITANTINIFIDGVKGGFEDTVPVDLGETPVSYLQIGALNDATSQAFGSFGSIVISPICFSDAEILGGPI